MNNKPAIITIAGLQSSGKTTIAEAGKAQLEWSGFSVIVCEEGQPLPVDAVDIVIRITNDAPAEAVTTLMDAAPSRITLAAQLIPVAREIHLAEQMHWHDTPHEAARSINNNDVVRTAYALADEVLVYADSREQNSLLAALRTHCNELERRLADHVAADENRRALVRELDVLLNGEEGAAKQASLCDIVSQLSTLPQPVLAHCKP